MNLTKRFLLLRGAGLCAAVTMTKTMNRKKKLALLAGFAGIVMAISSPGGGVDDSNGVFQLEGNATNDTSVCVPLGSASCTNVAFGSTTHDWADVNSGASGAAATTGIVVDLTNSGDDDIFTGGSTKDTLPFSGTASSAKWLFKSGKPQAKDDIAHAYAAAYTRSSDGHTLIYFGMDRFDNSGDATAGFWFVQDSTTGGGTIDSNGNPVVCGAGSGCLWGGHHFDNDLLIVSDFSTGGAVSTIEVFKWSCPGATTGQVCDDSGSLVLATTSTVNCDPRTGSSSLCAIVNPVTVSSPWSFTNKSRETAFAHGEFLEGGLDLNTIFTNVPCFTTFFAETRSSTSPTATLSDFSPPASFPLCKVTATKTCTGSSIVSGNQVLYTFTGNVHNAGLGTLYNPTVADVLPAGASGSSLTLTQPTGPIVSGGDAAYSGSFTANAVLSANDKNLVSVSASSNTSGTPQNVTCGTNPPTSASNACANWGNPTTGGCPPSITTSLKLTKACKSCLVGNGDLHVSVSEAFKICNFSNVEVSNITIQDCKGTIGGTLASPTCSAGSFTTINVGTLAPNACSGQFSSSYTPTSTAACTGNTCLLSDYAIASGTAALGGGTVSANGGVPIQASCPVCPVQFDCDTNPPVASTPTP